MTFNEFLEEKFDELREVGGRAITKDNCEEMRDFWFERLDVDELIKYGGEYGRYVAYETASDIQDKIITITLQLHDNWKQK